MCRVTADSALCRKTGPALDRSATGVTTAVLLPSGADLLHSGY